MSSRLDVQELRIPQKAHERHAGPPRRSTMPLSGPSLPILAQELNRSSMHAREIELSKQHQPEGVEPIWREGSVRVSEEILVLLDECYQPAHFRRIRGGLSVLRFRSF